MNQATYKKIARDIPIIRHLVSQSQPVSESCTIEASERTVAIRYIPYHLLVTVGVVMEGSGYRDLI